MKTRASRTASAAAKRKILTTKPASVPKKAARKTFSKPSKEVCTPKKAELLQDRRNDWSRMRQQLHVSTVPDSLPGRQNEFDEIQAHVSAAVEEKSGCCLYVSGVPGTGKTATIRHVIRSIAKDTRGVSSIEINGMHLTDPSYAYVLLWEHISGKKRNARDALNCLQSHFEMLKNKSRMQQSVLVVLDELDVMFNAKQTVIYNFLNWPAVKNSNLIVIAIANTMDLPERALSNKITSRLGLIRMNFKPYVTEQLIEIITARVSEFNAFEKNSIEFVARKISAVSGDARRALDLCRRCCEMTEQGKKITAKIVNEAIAEMLGSSAIKHISRFCSLHQKVFLSSMLKLFQETGISEVTFGTVSKKHVAICESHGISPLPNGSILAQICSSLAGSQIIRVLDNNSLIDQRISLVIPEEDLVAALKSHESTKELMNAIRL